MYEFHVILLIVSGVADQLQTNYASDLRNILKSVFDMNCSQSPTSDENCDNSTSDVFTNEVQSETFRDGSFNDNSSLLLNHDLSGALLNNNLRDEDERDRSSVDSAEEVVPDVSLSSPLVISEINQENENNRITPAGMFPLSFLDFSKRLFEKKTLANLLIIVPLRCILTLWVLLMIPYGVSLRRKLPITFWEV